jgi:hypothetical protein
MAGKLGCGRLYRLLAVEADEDVKEEDRSESEPEAEVDRKVPD